MLSSVENIECLDVHPIKMSQIFWHFEIHLKFIIIIGASSPLNQNTMSIVRDLETKMQMWDQNRVFFLELHFWYISAAQNTTYFFMNFCRYIVHMSKCPCKIINLFQNLVLYFFSFCKIWGFIELGTKNDTLHRNLQLCLVH